MVGPRHFWTKARDSPQPNPTFSWNRLLATPPSRAAWHPVSSRTPPLRVTCASTAARISLPGRCKTCGSSIKGVRIRATGRVRPSNSQLALSSSCIRRGFYDINLRTGHWDLALVQGFSRLASMVARRAGATPPWTADEVEAMLGERSTNNPS